MLSGMERVIFRLVVGFINQIFLLMFLNIIVWSQYAVHNNSHFNSLRCAQSGDTIKLTIQFSYIHQYQKFFQSKDNMLKRISYF